MRQTEVIRKHGELSLASSFTSSKEERAIKIINTPLAIRRELNNRSLYNFLEYFWDVVSNDEFKPNWHVRYLCEELQIISERVGERRQKEYDLIINVPPGMTKTIICSIMYPAWCWTRWYYLRFIAASYSGALALESAEYSRDLIRSDKFKSVYPELAIKEDKDTKGNFKIVKHQAPINGNATKDTILSGGNRFSTSVGGTLTGYHGHIHLIDDPLDPRRAASEVELEKANHWCDQTLSTRKTDKKVTTMILIMQRLHQNDTTGHLLSKKGKKIKHICLPGEIKNFKDMVSPPILILKYKNDLLDPIRLDWHSLDEMKSDLGQYGYAGQVGQHPVPPGGGMFKVENFAIVDSVPTDTYCVGRVRYWDKAGTQEGGAYTCGVRMVQLTNGKWIVEDVIRGQWSAENRERIIKETAWRDGRKVTVWVEQEPGSGGKESAEGTIRNLAGLICKAERPTGDKVFRADPYSVQVNNNNVLLLRGIWNQDFIEEHRYFPYSTFKDQVDAAAAAFNKLVGRRVVRRIT